MSETLLAGEEQKTESAAEETSSAASSTEQSGGDWRGMLPPEYREDKTFANFKGIGDLAKSYVEGRKYISSSVRVPPADAPKEEWAKFNRAMGIPESPDKYTKLDRTAIPEGFEFDEDSEKRLDAMAHKLGLSDRKAVEFKQMVNSHALETLQGEEKSETMSRSEAEEQLKKDLGKAFVPSLAIASRFVKNTGGDEFLKYLDETGIGNDPRFIKFMIKVAKTTAEDRSIDGSRGVDDFGVSPEEALSQIKEIRGDKAHPFNNSKHPEHNQWIGEKGKMQGLYRFAYPER